MAKGLLYFFSGGTLSQSRALATGKEYIISVFTKSACTAAACMPLHTDKSTHIYWKKTLNKGEKSDET